MKTTSNSHSSWKPKAAFQTACYQQPGRSFLNTSPNILKCGILNALDGSQDNAIWADIPVEISGEDLNQDDCLEDDVDDLDPFSDDEDTN